MKLWDKGTETDKLTERFTTGNDRELDMLLAPFDVIGSLAHTEMLKNTGMLTPSEHSSLRGELLGIYKNIEKGEFFIEDGVEDIHSQVEVELIRRLGDTGKKIHTGRSRNDQVALDIKLFTRNRIERTSRNINTLFSLLMDMSDNHKEDLMPGFTHTQEAMPSSWGLLLGSYGESLTEDMIMFRSAYRISNMNPLGSGAGYGSSFPLNREMTTRLMGFEGLNYNSINAQESRIKTAIATAFAICSAATTLSRIASDMCLFMNRCFGYISFPENLTTGSSIMPHKKNPDVFEIIRANCNRLKSLPNECMLISANLISGYHRDYQLLKENLLPSFRILDSSVEMMVKMLQNAVITKGVLYSDEYSLIFSVEEVNRLVLKGIPFRDAYRKVAEQIKEGSFSAGKNIAHTHEGSIGNLCNDRIRERMENIINEFPFNEVNKAVSSLLGE